MGAAEPAVSWRDATLMSRNRRSACCSSARNLRRIRSAFWELRFGMRHPVQHSCLAVLAQAPDERCVRGSGWQRFSDSKWLAGNSAQANYQILVGPLIAPDRMVSRTSSIDVRPNGAIPPSSSRVSAGTQWNSATLQVRALPPRS